MAHADFGRSASTCCVPASGAFPAPAHAQHTHTLTTTPQAEKGALAGEPIMVVLGSLHAALKGLWAFKVEAEGCLKAAGSARQAQHNDHVAALKAQVWAAAHA